MSWGESDKESGLSGGNAYATTDVGVMNALDMQQGSHTSIPLTNAEISNAQNRISQIAEEVRRAMPSASDQEIIHEIVQRSQGQIPPNMDFALVNQYAQQAATQTDTNIMNNTPGGASVSQQEEERGGVGSWVSALFSGAVGMFALKHANDEIGGKLTAQDDRDSRREGYTMLAGGNLLAFNDFSATNPHVREPGLEAGLAEGASRAASIGAAMGPQQAVTRNDAGGGMMRQLT